MAQRSVRCVQTFQSCKDTRCRSEYAWCRQLTTSMNLRNCNGGKIHGSATMGVGLLHILSVMLQTTNTQKTLLGQKFNFVAG